MFAGHMGAQPLGSHITRDRSDIDDASIALGQHLLQLGPHRIVNTREVHVHHPIPTAAADESEYAIDDTIRLRDDAGRTAELTVVALTNGNLALRGSVVVDGESFPASSAEKLRHRTYAAAPGGLQQIRETYPEMTWSDNEAYIQADLEAGQSTQISSLLSMFGGITLVAFVALMYSVLTLKRDLRGVPVQLHRLAVGASTRTLVASILGLTIGVGMVVMAALAIVAADRAVSDLLVGIGTPVSLGLPIGAFVVAGIVGLILPTVVFVGRHPLHTSARARERHCQQAPLTPEPRN